VTRVPLILDPVIRVRDATGRYVKYRLINSLNYIKYEQKKSAAHYYTTVYRNGLWYMIDEREYQMPEADVSHDINRFSRLVCYAKDGIEA
jgi:hypothetical protein